MEQKEEQGRDRIESPTRIVINGQGMFPKEVVIALRDEGKIYRLVRTRKGGFLLQ